MSLRFNIGKGFVIICSYFLVWLFVVVCLFFLHFNIGRIFDYLLFYLLLHFHIGLFLRAAFTRFATFPNISTLTKVFWLLDFLIVNYNVDECIWLFAVLNTFCCICTFSNNAHSGMHLGHFTTMLTAERYFSWSGALKILHWTHLGASLPS